jgi:hypothetical protein
MSSREELVKLVVMRSRALRLAEYYVRLVPVSREISPHNVLGEDVLTVYPNAIIVYYNYEPKRRCPLYVRRWLEGRRQYVKEGDDTIAQHNTAKYMAFQALAAFIMREWGFDGYIQNELPF